MNYSDNEHYGVRTEDDEALIDEAVRLLPALGKSLYCAIADLAQAHRLTPAQMKVLLTVGAEGQMTIGEIASALAVSMPAASEIVDRLVDANHLLRASDAADRRRVLIAATPASQRMYAELIDVRRAQMRRALDQFDPAERPTFVRSLRALAAGLNPGGDSDAQGCQQSETGSVTPVNADHHRQEAHEPRPQEHLRGIAQ